MNQAKFEWYLLSFILLLVAVVFWQVYGYMTEAGMASGGPLNNAAAYPKALAILLVVFAAIRSITKLIRVEAEQPDGGLRVSVATIGNAVLLLLFFGLYLAGLKWLGYHLMTPLFLVAVLFMIGERKVVPLISFAIVASVSVAFIFEVLLNIVLPGGVFRLNVPW